MRVHLVLSLLVASAASAQAISGTFAATFPGFNSFGVPTVHLELRLMCSLTCPPSAPELHYRVATATDGWFAAAPTEKAGYLSASFGSDPTGVNVRDSDLFPPGAAIKFIAAGASCHCGNAVGQGGYVDVTAPDLVIPPYVFVGSIPARVGYEWSQIINAKPKGNETVVVRFVGGGLDTTATLVPSDFNSSGTGATRVTPTAAGMMTVTAKLMPYDVGYTAMVPVNAGSGGSGGSGGGGTAGGGGDAGGGEMPVEGCAAAPAGVLFPLAALALIRRRRWLR